MPNNVWPTRTVVPKERIRAGAENRNPAPAPSDPAEISADGLPASGHCRECLAALAHRLAQPITALRGGIELGLLREHSAAEYQAILKQSQELADRMAQLIVSLRDLGESGAPAGAAQNVSIEQMVRDVQREVQALAESRELRLQVAAQGPAQVCANPDRLREALQELLAWIIQNSTGGSVLTVEVSAVDGEAWVVLVPPRLDLQYLQIKMLADILNPGLLFSHATKSGALGWAISQRLVNTLGGKLDLVTDGPSAGCIRMRLPASPENQSGA
jgi:two-component system sensor histidine kinase BaeS